MEGMTKIIFWSLVVDLFLFGAEQSKDSRAVDGDEGVVIIEQAADGDQLHDEFEGLGQVHYNSLHLRGTGGLSAKGEVHRPVQVD